MARERSPDFADRLPRLVPREEADISHLSDEMADVLYPGRRPRPFRIGLRFDAFEGDDHARAVDLARRGSGHRPAAGGDAHETGFGVDEAPLLRDLYALVGRRPGTEVTVDGKRLPYGAELWLPLFWIFLGQEA
jgi:hypothetical protein